MVDVRLAVGCSLAAILLSCQARAAAMPAIERLALNQVAGAAPSAINNGVVADPQTDSEALTDIVVTAQRRSERLQNVPIAVTALSPADLGRANISDVVDLRLAVPSLNIANTNGNLNTSLRGVGSTAVNAGYENPVALYVDGIYIASAQASFLNLSNIAQVEVLKGPQGTLFGRNATAGLIQITTRTPTADFRAEGRVAYSNYELIEGNAYVAGGLAPNLFTDIAVYAGHQDTGWGRDRTTGHYSYIVEHNIAVRSKIVFEPTSRTTITLSGDYANSSDRPTSSQTLQGTINGYTPAAGPAPYLGYDVVADSPQTKAGWAAGGSIKLEQDIGFATLIDIAAYRSSHYDVAFDYDLTALHLADVTYAQPDRQFSEEFQLQSRSGGRLSWVLGAFYFNATSAYDPFHLNLYYAGQLITIANHQQTESIAGYGQGTYEIFNNTKLTLGVRYTDEQRTAFDGTTLVHLIVPNRNLPLIVAPDRQANSGKITFRVALDRRFSPDVLGYVSFNRGFKSGGFNTGTPNSAAYLPESIDAYEVGVKTNFLNNRIRINAAGFYYDYTNIQSQQLAAGVIQIVNAAAAHIYGADIDFEAVIARDLRVTAGLGLVSPTYASYPGALIGTPLGGRPSTIGSDAGNDLPISPRETFNVGGVYTARLNGRGVIDVASNIYYNGGYYLESDNITRQGHLAQLGASVTWTSESGRYSVGAYGKNLTNRRILAYSATQAGNGTHSAIYTAPRTYGVSAGFKF